MPSDPREEFDARLARLAARDRLRQLSPRQGVDFASNDYLALAGHPAIAAALREAIDRGVPVGSGGSRLLRGNAPEHEALEAKAVAFFGGEAALWFANGFAANTALLSALPGVDDLIVADTLIHASAHDGMRLSRAPHRLAAHNDADSVHDAICQWRTEGGRGRPWIVVETLYSMDGDKAPLADLLAVAERHEAMLVLDEAHATAVHGPSGRGLAAELEGRADVVSLHTCGKGMGVEGAIVTGVRPVIELLVNRARSFVFSTAPSPLMAVAASAALDVVAQADDRRAALLALVARAGTSICAPLGLPAPTSQIVPVVIGEDGRTMAVAARLRDAGFDVRGIRPPTVPRGTARLRISLTLNCDAAAVDALGAALVGVMAGQPA